MGTITGFEIIEKASTDLRDPDGRRWTLKDLTDYLNAGQREIVILRPDANVVVRAVRLEAGSTRQSLPAEGLRLINITHNMGADGASAGSVVRVIDGEEIDALAPDWHSEPALASEVEHYVYDGRSPKTFYVYRKLRSARYVEMHFSASPVDVQVKGVYSKTANTAITLDDIYQTPLYDYVMMRAHAKDTDAQSIQESELVYRRFLNRLGLKVQVDKAFDPNRNSPPRDAKRGGEDARPAF